MTKGPSTKTSLTLTPLGGVGEIGSNCTVIENENSLTIIDYGILFPYEDFFDINYLVASLDSIKDTKKSVSIFITHGHEDHIGAICHLMEVFPNATIRAPNFAIKLMRVKLHKAGMAAKIEQYNESTILDFDNYEIHPVAVTHSIPDTYGLVIQEKKNAFSVLFISDFKFDLKPLYEEPFNYQKIQSLFKDSAKRICMIDSTNILNQGRTLSESEVVDDLSELIALPRRIFITLFSSNIYRLKTIFLLAQKHGKRVVPIGRSVHHYIESAKECGFFGDEIKVLRREEEVKNAKSSEYLYILTGCQGDHFGALRRVVSGEHKFLAPLPNDLFIFSSKPIPGNEKKIVRIYNQITEKGADLITARDKQIHASGHPSQLDLQALYGKIAPDLVIPIHGESYFLRKHVEFVESNNIAQALFVNNFEKIQISNDAQVELVSMESEDPTIIHGKALPIEREAIS
ncbi:MAG: ribonuclease J, partial [Bacteriovoracaceae bacterium]|nr:ribonuclease J [Bacteriovoracaceae bacterium]